MKFLKHFYNFKGGNVLRIMIIKKTEPNEIPTDKMKCS